LKERILEATKLNQHYMERKEKLQQGNNKQRIQNYELREDGILMYKGRAHVPNSYGLKNMVLREMHNVPYVGHLGYQKTIATFKRQYFWPGMKKEVAEYIARFLECQKEKDEHRHPIGFLQPFPTLKWKWEVVKIDFITKLPRINKKHDSIMVVVDKLTKDTHFIPVKVTHKETKIADIYIREIDKLHGVPKAIVSYNDTKFTSNFWKGLFR
jgi:hypothetical protein